MSNDAIPFALVDVFAVRPLTGNPLAVVLAGPGMDVSVMKALAREFNLAETTILLPPSDPAADWRLRSFTPGGVEIFGAGHNALGAWWWLADSGRVDLGAPVSHHHQELGGQVLNVTILSENGRPRSITMAQPAACAGATPADLGQLAAALGIQAETIGLENLPAQVVSTGDAHLMLPLRDRQVVDRIRPDPPALFAILEHLGAEGCYAFSLDPAEPRAFAYARFLNPADGPYEDPASGGAAGPLAGHLHAHGRIGINQSIAVEQGTAIGRASLIDVRVTATGIEVSGSAVVLGDGTLRLGPTIDAQCQLSTSQSAAKAAPRGHHNRQPDSPARS